MTSKTPKRRYSLHRSPHFATGKHMSTARQWVGISQMEMARLAGLHKGSVSYHENKEIVADGMAVKLISEVLAGHGVHCYAKHRGVIILTEPGESRPEFYGEPPNN